MPKIFELAKDLDRRALELVEELKGLGFNVRNHMSVLSDDETAKALKALEELKAREEEEKAAKGGKKKKKAKTKKKTVKKAVSGAKKKKSSVKKKSVKVMVKKGGPQKVDSASLEEPLPEGEKQGEKEDLASVTTASKEKIGGPGPKVVRKKASTLAMEKAQKAKEKEEEEIRRAKELEEGQGAETSEGIGTQQKGLKVVFDPTLGEDGSKKTMPDPLAPPSPYDPSGKSDRHGDKEDQSKKRMGALSQMMAKGRGGKRDLTQLRADEEMKSYGVMIGKVNYTPVGRKKVYLGPSEKTQLTEVKEEKRYVSIQGAATGAELAKKLKVKFKEFATKAMELNLLMKSTDYLGPALAQELADLYDHKVRDVSFKEDAFIQESSDPQEDSEGAELSPRGPVVAVMGHVDHGKTTLLDSLRKSKVVESEAGGITQHIGAYRLDVDGQKITVLDTPGHAAFAAMRQRGADVTDVVILVVAADDGVMPQTKESIRFCQNADVPIIVAVNKMDKEGANPDRVQQELMEFGLTPEEWGGETQYVKISALKGEGLDDLLETVKLLAEMLELKADFKGRAHGVVIESKVGTGRGPLATILVQKGILHKGDYLVVGESFGRVRSLTDYEGKTLKSASPAEPVQILGLGQPPSPGDIINVVKNEREAKKIAQNRVDERKQLAGVEIRPKLSLEDFFDAVSENEGEKKVLKLVIRADVQGSFEAIKNALEGLGNDEVFVEIIGGGVGAITNNDVVMASGSAGYIIGFNMRPVTSARRLAEERGVDIKTYSIIYELIDDIQAALEGLLDPEEVEIYIGRATVKETFVLPKKGTIAGSSVVDGKIKKGCHIRLLRDGKIVFTGKLSSLRRFKDDVKEVGNGLECGIGLENFNDVKQDDIFEAYLLEEKKRTLESRGGDTL
ncbi:MAG: translation initiation factor IF-2 [Bacteriovoracales bacterium]|nr:translation initiation factor IF-2 [Bacteriovoracales bacterium]